MNFPKITFKNIIKTSIEGVSLRELTHRRSFCLHLFLTGLLLTLSILQSNAQSNCVSGCNENAYLYSTVPNTLEYDNMVALFHTTMIKEANGDFKIWGQAANADGSNNVLSPTIVKPSNGYNYSGTPLKMTGGSTGAASAATQMALLTTEGLYIWGTTNHLVSTNIKNSTAMGTSPVSIGTSGVSNGTNPNYAKGLPNGVDPGQVKMLFGSYRTLAIVTCTGEVWVLSYNGNKNGDGTGTSGDNNYVWHKVFTSTTNNGSTKGAELSNVVAVRGTPNALFALTADGKLYTWGSSTYINNGAAANRTYATEIDISALSPAVTPKMIGMTQNEANQSYYLLATDGRLFTMGNNGQRQLGDFTTTNRNTWVQAKKSSASGSEFDDIVWISPNEHDDYGIAAINVLKSSDKKLWAWGNNDGNMIGGATNGSNYDPMEMPGTGTGPNDMKVTDNIVAVETGGHITLNLKECSQKYGYVGHKTNGSMGDGTSGSGNPNTYSYSTAVVVVCGAAVAPAIVDNMETCPGTTVNLYDAQLAAAPPGYEIKWYTDEAGTVEVDDPLTAGAGTYYAFYESISGGVKQCPEVKTVLTVSYLQPDDPSCAFDINGNVFNDLNGLNDGIVNGTGTDAGGNLYVVLVDKNNIVINVATVANDGTYAFTSIPKGEYTLVLSTSNPNNGDPAPSPSLPAGWINMGENIGSGSGDDGTPDGMISIDGSNGNITNANFGIFQMSPSIELKKSGSYTDKNGDGMASVGDEIHYTFKVTNTGNVALTNITVSDPKVMVNGGPVNLATGVSDNSSFTATYVITQADIDNGGIYNTATATGKDPIGDDVSGDSQDPDPLDPSDPNYDPNCPDCTYTPISQTPAISITKDGAYDAGTGEITYTFVVTNTGNVSLSNVAVTDPLLGGSWSHSIGSLAVGEIVPFTVTYTVTQADINANGVYNLATVTGKTPDGSDISEDSEDPTPLDPTDSNYDPNCPNCTFVPIPWAEIAANDDNFGGINGADGGTTPSVLDNDELNGSPVDPSDVTLTPGTPSDPALSMNPDGTIDVAPGTPAGTYTYPYTICEIANPSNCDDATVTVVVGAPEIVANDDNFGGINGADGGTTPSVLDNDELNGSPVNPSDVTLTPGTPSDPALSMNPDGTVDVAPGTPAGTYTYPYTICEIANPSNCDNATVTVVVGAPEIAANDDNFGGINGADGGTTPSVLDNDELNGSPVNPSDVTLTPGTPSDPALSMNPDGTVEIAPGTPAGTYTYPYTICEIANPSNCDNATVTVVVGAPEIVANDDNFGGINGADGGTTPSVLDNDELNGSPVNPSDVTLTPGTPSDPALSMNPDGTIEIAPGTPAGTYTYPYTICEVANPSNCDDATVTVVVGAPAIVANDDNFGGINGADGGTTLSVLDNDELNGSPVNPSDVTLTPGTPSDPALSMNPDGTIEIAPGTPAGTYTYPYTICEVLNPGNCDDATVTLVVGAPEIVAKDDNFGGINGADGGTTPSVLDNDELNGSPVNPSDVTLTPGTPSDPALSMNPDGTIEIAPGTPAGTYTYPYTICEVLNPGNCDDATVTLVVGAPEIVAKDDNFGGINGADGGTTPSVLDNDELNGSPVNPSDVTLTPGTPSDPALSMNPDGTVEIAPGTPAGTYTYPYTICEIANPSNCDDATVTVVVGAPEIVANDDNFGGINGADGGTTPSVLDNDELNGNPVNPSDVTLTPGTPGDPALSMNPDGTIEIAPGTPAGTYTYPYTICEIANPSNCDDATVTVVVGAPAIAANDDNFGGINGADGGTTPSVLDNDELNGSPVDPSDVTLTPGTPSDPALSMNPDGTIEIAPGTPAGTYTYPYTICEVLNPSNCDDATVTVVVGVPAIAANDDNFGGINGADGGTTPSVLDNDELNGSPVNPSDVTLTPGTPSDPALSMNPDGTIEIAPGTPAGTYTYPYTICEVLNPGNCDDATVTVVVGAPEIVANDDNFGGINGADGGTTPSVLDNDELNGSPVNPSDVTLTPGTPSDPALSMNPDGTIEIAPGTPAGTYTYPYTICEVLNPGNCDDATVTVVVGAPEIVANDDNFGGINGADGGTTPSVLDNDELNGSPVNPSDVTLTPGTPSDPALSMNPDGTVDVAPGTPAGTYTYPYTICEIANPSNCDDATVTVVVGAPEIVANDDNFGGINGADGGTTPSVLDNDELNGSPVDPSDVTLTPGTPSDPALSMNPDGTVDVAPGTPAGTYTYPYTICEIANPSNCDDATVTVVVTGIITGCVVPNLKVLLEGPFADKGDGSTMTTKLNNLGYLPGQKPVPFFGVPTPVGQPYGIAPWNYAGTEGINYDKSLQGPKAGYAADITDWVLVSLRETTSPSSTVCRKAALLHSDGSVEMVNGFDCCEIDINKQYYVVVEHRNHLIVMSNDKLPVISSTITYDFTKQQSYRGLLGYGQKYVSGKFLMYAGNGDQVQTTTSIKDINAKDKDLWLIHNGENSQYNINDFELNGDVNVQDKNMWLDNNSIFTDVPR